MASTSRRKVIIVPGNGCTNIRRSNWFATVFAASVRYGWLADKLAEYSSLDVICRNFPDPYVARETAWLPFIKNELGADENTILIGHSSGAEAILRYLEKEKVFGAVVVSACWTDLGDENEAASGYYSRPWLWEDISKNATWLIQYGSTDDPFIPIEEQRHVAEHSKAEYLEYNNQGHFMSWEFELLFEKLKEKLGL